MYFFFGRLRPGTSEGLELHVGRSGKRQKGTCFQTLLFPSSAAR